MYPNVVIEVSKSHESFSDMFDDANIKHFSPLTSVRVWIGIKLTPGYGGRMRAMFRLRDHVAGSGTLVGSGATTDYISMSQPTNVEFIIPKSSCCDIGMDFDVSTSVNLGEKLNAPSRILDSYRYSSL